MIKGLYRRLPGSSSFRISLMILMALVIFVLVIWSYELLGDILDSGGTVDG